MQPAVCGEGGSTKFCIRVCLYTCVCVRLHHVCLCVYCMCVCVCLHVVCRQVWLLIACIISIDVISKSKYSQYIYVYEPSRYVCECITLSNMKVWSYNGHTHTCTVQYGQNGSQGNVLLFKRQSGACLEEMHLGHLSQSHSLHSDWIDRRPSQSEKALTPGKHWLPSFSLIASP